MKIRVNENKVMLEVDLPKNFWTFSLDILPGITFVVHRPWVNGRFKEKEWSVSESTTGYCIRNKIYFSGTKSHIKTEAEQVIKQHGVTKFNKLRGRIISKYGALN